MKEARRNIFLQSLLSTRMRMQLQFMLSWSLTRPTADEAPVLSAALRQSDAHFAVQVCVRLKSGGRRRRRRPNEWMAGAGGRRRRRGRRDEEGREGRPESAAKVPKIPTVGSEIAGRWEGEEGRKGEAGR